MNDPAQPVVDLVIPAHNEQENIPTLLASLPDAYFRHILLVNNGSTDGTAGLGRIGGATVIDEPDRGYGSACLAGLAWIRASDRPPDIVAFIDADLADDPVLLPGLCEPIVRTQADLVIASRHRLAMPGALTGPQRFGNKLACRIIRLLTGQKYTDLGPMRAVRWSSLLLLNMSDRTWGWTVEMQYKAAICGLEIVELEVPYRPRRAGVSKISGSLIGSARAGYKILATIAKLWWQHTCRRG